MRMWQKTCAAGALLAVFTLPAVAQRAPTWHTQLAWHGHVATIKARQDGGFVLDAPGKQRVIAPQRWSVHTASALFDGLFAMAQADLGKDAVNAITDGAFDHGKPIACRCFVAGAKWPFVWTRDLSFSTDLGLWRIDPARVRASLLFKLSDTRGKGVSPGQYVMQDTGSGGSWPISSDRVVWFLGARHLLDDKAFANTVHTALVDTLRQDRRYLFDKRVGLYRGETSFLDWRQQSYPAWTADNVVFIAQSFALSTNVLHYQALRLAQRMAGKRHHDAAAARYRREADALKHAINAHFWRADTGLYMSYIGGRVDPAPFDAYDLLGTDLAIVSGVADGQRARQALAHYPTAPAGSPVIWPQRADQPVYHNRAVWPFVSEYTLRAARRVNDPARIAHALRSQMRAAALNASNMENFPLDAPWLGAASKADQPQVDSPRQLWSVAGYLDMVVRGVFGLENDGSVKPKLPTSLVPMLFGQRDRIELDLGTRRIVLQRPRSLAGSLLVAGSVHHAGNRTVVQLVAKTVRAPASRTDATLDLPATPAAPKVTAAGKAWRVQVSQASMLYVNGRRYSRIRDSVRVPNRDALQCFSVTVPGAHGLASLHSPETCVGPVATVAGAWPRQWRAAHTGDYTAWLRYANDHGPINTGITAAVKRVRIACGAAKVQVRPVVMPQSDGEQHSTQVRFHAHAGDSCRFALEQGFNMSNLSKFVHYTGGQGGAGGPLNGAAIGTLKIAPLPDAGH
ncbi:MAG TPA: Six-hairpin glycosidase-like protein [Rhodanobacteraceae bacterium]